MKKSYLRLRDERDHRRARWPVSRWLETRASAHPVGITYLGLCVLFAATANARKICGDPAATIIRTRTVIYAALVALRRTISTCAASDRWPGETSVRRDGVLLRHAVEPRSFGSPHSPRSSPPTLKQETVDFIPHFDHTARRPVGFSSRIPNLLVTARVVSPSNGPRQPRPFAGDCGRCNFC